jgi:hypothetical protein
VTPRPTRPLVSLPPTLPVDLPAHLPVRRLLAGAYAALAPVVILAAATPALAFGQHRSDGDQPGHGISILEGIAIYVGIPVLLGIVLTGISMLPSTTRGPRYRPGLGWRAAPVWFGGPRSAAEREQALSAAPIDGNGGVSAEW